MQMLTDKFLIQVHFQTGRFSQISLFSETTDCQQPCKFEWNPISSYLISTIKRFCNNTLFCEMTSKMSEALIAIYRNIPPEVLL